MKEILHVLGYFMFFQYPPTFEEIHAFMPVRIEKAELRQHLDRLEKQGKINSKIFNFQFSIYNPISKFNYSDLKHHKFNFNKAPLLTREGNKRGGFTKTKRYIIAGSLVSFSNFATREKNSLEKIKSVLPFLKLIHYIPFVRYIGISGSAAMKNAGNNDDVDIFVITSKDTIWLTRFLILIAKRLVLLFDSSAALLCFNLFFEGDSLRLPSYKKNEYTGHEVVQLKDVYDKNHYRDKLMNGNRWIQTFFPNVQINFNTNDEDITYTSNLILQKIDHLTKKIQVFWLRSKNYSWKEKNGQLWLLQADIEKKLRSKNII